MNIQKNSNEMKTEVETFVIEETEKLIYDNELLNKWNELVAECGLVGQTKIRVKEKSPIPFMHLKISMVEVFKTLCPKKVSVEDFDISPIPVEILDLIALSKRESYFESIEIWYDDKNPDPVCIGSKSTYYTYDKKTYNHIEKGLTKQEADKRENEDPNISTAIEVEVYYILGKWGDVKHSFSELKQMATERYIAKQENSFKQNIKYYTNQLNEVVEQAFNKFN